MLSMLTNPAIICILLFVLAFAAFNIVEKGRWD